jgi:5-methylcytosine-specific restriction endonuclease McrA
MPTKPLPPCRIQTCPNLGCTIPEHQRPSAAQRGYDGDWQAARIAFLAANPRCVACGQPANTVDHDPPHRGDRRAFWDRRTWRPMCTTCHNAKHDVSAGLGSRRLR